MARRRRFIAGNWKMNLGPTDAAALAEALKSVLASRGDVDVAVFPPTLSIAAVVPALAGSGIEVGIQDVHDHPQGAFTGENSPVVAREVGCTRALAGHSERRTLFGESDATVGSKVRAALAAGLLPIVCIGESLPQRESGQVEAVVFRQLAAALDQLKADQLAAITLAYEPVWAIGTGRVATPEQAQDVHAALRGWVRAHFPAYVADEMRIQYGGSVNAKNASTLLACPDVDGALVGGASLKASEFAAIVLAT
jgi:triosephosphate isomerase